MRTVGVLDRTGALLPLVEAEDDVKAVDLGRPADLGPAAPRVDVLVIGPKECTAAGVRRLSRWSAVNPASPVVAFVPAEGTVPDAELRAAGVKIGRVHV